MKIPKQIVSVPMLFLTGLFFLVACQGISPGQPTEQPELFVSEAVAPAESPVVAEIVSAEPEEILIREINPHMVEGVDFREPEESVMDPVVPPADANLGRTPALTLSFEGLGTQGPLPPDTSGEVGPEHYVQMVNIRFAVYDKTGSMIAGPTAFNDLYAGGQCAAQNAGDPIVLYDELAERWLLSQFFKTTQGGGMCIAISQTPDPTGAYFLYEFVTPQFPDYPKFGVWPDGYYMSDNGGRPGRYSAYVFEREKMLAGQPARFLSATGFTNFMLPSDLDGATPPPTGSPNYFYTYKDNATHGGADRLEIYELHVDWATPNNSTITLVQNIPIAPFTYTVCGFFVRNCIPQAGTSQGLDSLSYWPMWRFPYRNFGDHEALVGNFAVDVDGSDWSGIRWFELRKEGDGGWALHQEGTHAPDTDHRFMSSIAMDQAGNIALGYTASGEQTFPSIRYATRLADDPVGTLQVEATLQASGGSQTHNSGRWGDYSTMSVDPIDGCTFWYTNQYYRVPAPGAWQTRIGVFHLPECGEAPEEPGAEEQVYEYAAKFICGVQKDPDDLRLARGFYATTINVHNPNEEEVKFRKLLALAIPPGKQESGEILRIAEDTLRPDAALAVDCADVAERLFQGSLPAPYIDGFILIQSTASLDVTGVYSVAALDESGRPLQHSSTDVVQIRERVK